MLLAACDPGPALLYLDVKDARSVAVLHDIMGPENELLGCEAWSVAPGEHRRHVEVVDARPDDANQLGVCEWYPGNWNSMDIHWAPFLDGRFSRLVMLHELGHAEGLEHEPGTVMNLWLLDDMTVEEGLYSLAALMRAHHLNPCDQKGVVP